MVFVSRLIDQLLHEDTIKSAELPDDVQVILFDLANELGEINNLPEVIPVEDKPIASYLKQAKKWGWETGDTRGMKDVEELSRLLKDGEDIPPIIVDGDKLLDGRHRLLAAEKVGLTTLSAIEIRSIVPKDILRPFGDKRTKQVTAPQDIPQSYGFVVVKEGKILLVKPRGADFWEIPKGALDGKEAPKKAAARETREETGVIATPTKTLGFVVDEDWNDGEGKVVYAWLADYEAGLIDGKTGKSLKIQKEEVEEAKFFEPEEALDTVVDYLKPIIKKAIGSTGEFIDDIIDALIDEDSLDRPINMSIMPIAPVGSAPKKTATPKGSSGGDRHWDCKQYTDDIPAGVNAKDTEGWCKEYKELVVSRDLATRNGKPCPKFKRVE